MITEATLTPETQADGRVLYRVSGTGRQPFWPHDGDLVQRDEIGWLRDHKGWIVKIGRE